MKRLSRFWHENWLAIAVLGALLSGYLVLRTKPTEFASADAFVTGLKQGQPTIVEFYANT